MRIIVDADRCGLHGECVGVAPEVFEIDDDNDSVAVVNPHPDESLRSAVEEAALRCPVQALRLEA